MSRLSRKYIRFGTGSNDVNSRVIPAHFTPSNYSPSQVASEGNDKVSAHLKGIDTALASGSLPTVFGSRTSPRLITASSGVNSSDSHMSTTATNQIIFVQGSGGEVDITANPQIEAHTVVGAKMILIGRSNNNTVRFDNGSGLELNGSAILGESDILELIWDGSSWIEVTRNI